MRMKKIQIFLLFTLMFIINTNKVVAVLCCDGYSCGETNLSCQFNTWVCRDVNNVCPEGEHWSNTCSIVDNCEATSPYAYCVGSTIYCEGWQCVAGDEGPDQSCGFIVEVVPVYCGDCQITPIPGNNTSTPAPTHSPAYISGSIQQDIDAVVSGGACTQGTTSPLNLTGLNLIATKDAINYPSVFSPTDSSVFSINTGFTGTGYEVTLDLSNQSGSTDYVCSCPAAVDPSNLYLCRYSGVTSPTSDLKFYLKERDLSNNSWFQVFGSNLFSQTGINSAVPYDTCAADADCQAALSVPKIGSTNVLSSGFSIANSSSSDSIKSSIFSSFYHSYLNLASRISNVNSYATSTNIAPVSYDYFYKLAENSMQQIGNGEDLEPLLSDWTGSAWWSSTDINYVRVNGNVSIDETQGFNLSSSQKLVVFVDGNLTLDDSDVNDINRKITSVANGGFLAFFASGNILITPKVGYELNPSIPTVPSVTNANSNLEGVFVANGSLTLQSKSAIGEVPPDKKFIGAGTFVGWTAVNLNRTFDDGVFGAILNNNQAIENFFYRPDLLANWPTKLKASVSNWREVDPQLINQQ